MNKIQYTHNNLLKSVLSHATIWMNFEDKKSNHKKTNAVRFHLHEVSKLVKFTETESRMLDIKGSGRAEWGGV